MFTLPCVIFAGGKSSRMGEDKTLLPFGDFTTITEYQYTRLSKIFSKVYISCKDASKFHFQANFIEDLKTSTPYAPTIGFLSAFHHIKEDSFFVLSVDAPFIKYEIIEQLILADSTELDATISKSPQGLQPLCGIYHRSLLPSFERMLQANTHKLYTLLQNSNTLYVYFENANSFINLNHPHEYQEALQIINSTSL